MLTEPQKLIRRTVRQFAQRELAPTAAERDRTARFPAEAFAAMGRLGFLGMVIPQEFDGAGADYVSYALAVMEIAAADGATSTSFQVHNSLTCLSILRHGTAEQKERYLRPLASGQQLGAFCLTEPEAGSDAASIKTRARREGNKFVLNGVKQFITSGKSADLAVVFAVTDPDAGKRGLSAFIVPTKTPGYIVGKVEHTMGQRSSDHCQIVFDDCAVLPEQMLGEEGEGLKIALANLEGGRIGVAAQAVGMGRAAYEAALAELMVLRAAALRDAGRPCLKEASMAKLFATEAAEQVCNDAIQIHGGYGYLNDFPVERIYRDVRVCKIYEGTSEIQRLVISRQIKSEDKFNGVGEE